MIRAEYTIGTYLIFTMDSNIIFLCNDIFNDKSEMLKKKTQNFS